MKILINPPSESMKDSFFGIALRSKSGANIRVGKKLYKVYVDNTGEYNIDEVIPEFELTEEEFKKINKYG